MSSGSREAIESRSAVLDRWTLSAFTRRKTRKLTKSQNIYHQAKRIQKEEFNDPERTRGRKYHQFYSNTFDIATD